MMPWLGRGYVDPRDARSLVTQSHRFRMWRPWMWGPLGRFWALHYEAAHDGQVWGPDSYTWMSRKERKEPTCERD
jgi:hypothetical protein